MLPPFFGYSFFSNEEIVERFTGTALSFKSFAVK